MSTQSMLLLVFLTAVAINNGFCSGNSNALLCIKSEREALLKFKQDVRDPSSRLASWADGEGDCCKWAGVVCNNVSGHVQELHLRNPHAAYDTGTIIYEYEAYLKSMLGGKISPSLLNLKHLNHLDLGHNNFTGMVPSQLGNLSALQHLTIGGFYGQSLYVETLQWLPNLSLLRHLDLSYVNLSRASNNWLQFTNTLASLVELRLSVSELHHFPSLPHDHVINFTNLVVLDLSNNNFNSSIPDWLCSLNGLETLSLRGSSLYGAIPSGLPNMTRLRDLDLSFNGFNSTIPDSLYSFRHLEHLNLGYNSLKGSISSAIGNLTSAISLDLSYNELEGKMPTSFANLCSLREISLSGVSFGGEPSEILEILSKCILGGLEVLELGGSRLSGHFPDVIEQLGQSSNKLDTLDLIGNSLSGPIPVSIVRLSSLKNLYLSDNELKGTLPDCLGQLASLEDFQISHNRLQGIVSEVHFVNLTKLRFFYANGNNLTFRVSPDWVPSFQVRFLFLSSCQLGPQFPMWLHSQKNLAYLDISRAGISDKIPSWFWNMAPLFRYLNLSHNHIQGAIAYIPSISEGTSIVDLGSNGITGSLPSISSNVTELYLSHNSFSGSLSFFLCYRMDEAKNLRTLDLEGNLLSGEVPDCWMNWPRLAYVNLDSNHLTGHVPSSMRFLSLLQSLHLRNNLLSGGFPSSLQNCTELLFVDLGKNQFSENIPAWIGERLSKLKILILQSNKFRGHIPIEICRLRSLQIIAFAHNNLSGTIPRCFYNISAMVGKPKFEDDIMFHRINLAIFYSILDNAILVMKGKEAEYSTILLLVTLLDLSNNNLSGEIPKELTNLARLRFLNLSRNNLAAKIPAGVGSMISLESIDFSANHLYGEIPTSLSSLTLLNHLNLSYNNLTGKIPLSTQLQSFDTSSFIGNKLCGPPLVEKCPVNDVIPNAGNEGGGKDGDGLQVEWFNVSMGLGFVVGFWGVFGPVLLNRSWRFSYYQFLDGMWFKFCSVITHK